MKYLQSEALLDLLVQQTLLSPKQRQFFTLEKGKQRQKLLKKKSSDEIDTNYPDQIDLLVAFNFSIGKGEEDILDEETIMRAVAREKKLPFKKLDPLELEIEIVTKTIPRNFAMRQMILPFNIHNGILELAVYNPDCQTVLTDVEQAIQMKVKPYISTKADITKTLSEFFGFQHSISAAENQFGAPGVGGSVDIGNLERYVRISSAKGITSSDQHIKSAVNHVFNYALDQRASDIHIEPKRENTLIRFRIDGGLHTIYKLPKAVHSALVSRIKFLARMDIAEKRRPQDGRIKVGVGEGKDVEIRVSTVPVSFGEKAVMRLLDPDIMFQQMDNLGFSRRDRAVYNTFMHSPHGIVLVTGPTGSGKSTTLYSTLKQIATPDKNIVTVEDPVEMVHEEFNQIAVQPLIDVTFSTILRNILRQDPDILMIGEIRDLDTGTHAVQAAMTGHLVFSTLHTNDAVSSIIRLRDLGIPPFLITTTLLGCMAQRLVRRICPNCVERYQVDTDRLAKAGFPVAKGGTMDLMRGKGCRECRQTGYIGRCGVFEIFPMTPELKKLVMSDAPADEMRRVAIREGMTTLREDAWTKVREGVTTYEEALRVTSEY